MLVEVVTFTTDWVPGLVTTWTTLPDGIDAFKDHFLPEVKFCIVGVPGPVIVQTGQAWELPGLTIVLLPRIVPDDSGMGSNGRIPAATLSLNVIDCGTRSSQYGSGV
jgi:hypothetical protein